MGAIGAMLGLALRSPAAAVITALVILLALDPLLAGIHERSRSWGPGGAAGALTGSGGTTCRRLGGRPALLPTPPCSAPRRRRSPSAATSLLRCAMLASVDGAIGPAEEARIPVSDEGLLRGDGAFEVMRLYQRHARSRSTSTSPASERSCAGLRLDAGPGGAPWRGERSPAGGHAGPVEGLLRLVVTRGGRRIAIARARSHATRRSRG